MQCRYGLQQNCRSGAASVDRCDVSLRLFAVSWAYMKQLRSSLGMVTALAVICTNQAYAVEGATTGSQATQATVGVLDSKINVTNNFVTSIVKCNAVRKFYAPSDPNRDGNNCVGIQDYPLTMNNTSSLGTSNGPLVVTTQSNPATTWAAVINNTQAGDYGLLAYGKGGPGLYGESTSNWGGAFSGAGGVQASGSNSPGVQGNSTGNWGGYFTGADGVLASGLYGLQAYGSGQWAGYFNSTSTNLGVYISNNANNAQLCLNGSCVTSLNASGHNGGAFSEWNGVCGAQGSQAFRNPLTGDCSCPTGYSAAQISSIFDVTHNNWSMFICYQ
jgi:hypothetical protein